MPRKPKVAVEAVVAQDAQTILERSPWLDFELITLKLDALDALEQRITDLEQKKAGLGAEPQPPLIIKSTDAWDAHMARFASWSSAEGEITAQIDTLKAQHIEMQWGMSTAMPEDVWLELPDGRRVGYAITTVTPLEMVWATQYLGDENEVPQDPTEEITLKILSKNDPEPTQKPSLLEL